MWMQIAVVTFGGGGGGCLRILGEIYFSSMESDRLYDLGAVEYPLWARHNHEEAKVVAVHTPDHPLRESFWRNKSTSVLVSVY